MLKPDSEFYTSLNYLGRFYGVWSHFELLIEVAISESLNLNYETANLLLHGLSFGRKSSILKSALFFEGKEDSVELIDDIVNDAKRNALTHSLVDFNENNDEIEFNYRQSQHRFTLKTYAFTKDQMGVHHNELLTQAKELQSELGVTKDMILAYSESAKNLATKSTKLS